MEFRALAAQALAELGDALSRTDPAGIEALADAIAGAKRIALFGVGREGLMMRALTMRLFHMGLDAHVVGDMTTPPVGPGDLLLVSAGPGDFGTVRALVEVARGAGARTACVTAQPSGPVPGLCDVVAVLRAQTMADDRAAAASAVLPMGSLYEGAQYVAFEILILMLRARLNVTPEAMRARHTNLE